MHQTDPGTGELSFELLAEIAVGQTARVELCRVVEGPLKSELVAVKRLHPHIADDPQFVDMFRDEVWMTAALKHPHVVEVVGWGQDAVGPWLAVEFVRGVSLQRLMKTVFETGERFTERMVVYLARCICDGLAEAHNLRSANGDHLNLVHRDLTPGNILLGFDGQVKITDFGLAKAKQRLTKTLTGLLKGQPQYMSPEQVQGGKLDGRSDVFAMGVVLFELFGGRRPWNASSDLDAMRAITDEPAGDLFALRPRIDKALVEVVQRCLNKDQAKRWQSAEELRARFDEWLNAHGYRSDNHVSLARFVRRNAMRQMRWFERAIDGEFTEDAHGSQGMPRVSSLPAAPAPSPQRPVPLAQPRERTHHTRDERPPSARGSRDRPRSRPPVPPQREEVPTRLTDEPRDPDSIDWGDDGPTLVQRSQEARQAIKAARKAKSRQRLPGAGEPTTRRRRHGAPPPAKSSRKRRETVTQIQQVDETAEAPTAPRTPAGRSHDRAALEPGTPHPDHLGVVAPPDPDVPPPPIRASQAPVGRSPSAAPAHPARQPPPHELLGDEPSTRPDTPASLSISDEAVDATGMTRPLSRDEIERPNFDADVPSRAPTGPIPSTSPLPSSDAPVGIAALGAMPAPRFPSMPSLSRELPSMDVGSEAQRFGEAAKRAADFAEAAGRAARLAGEAAMMAADGQRHEAIARLREAQRIEEALSRGEVPSRDFSELASLPLEPPASQFARKLQSREGVTVLVIVCVGLFFVVLLLALLM
jgi:eukaryotic-like serine/threonine-protein kinase